jgi:hypothetical protein
MRSLALSILPFAGFCLIACGNSGNNTGGTGGTGAAGGTGGTGATTTSTTSGTTTSTTTTDTTTTTTTTTTPGCAGAVQLDFGSTIEGDLKVTGQEDYYKFKGTKGQVLWIDIDAQDIDQVSFDPTYIDSVVTLYDANEKRIAQNDNPVEFTTADPRLYTILPADGDYCLRVAECWSVASNPGKQCQAPKDKTNTAYELRVFELVDDGTMDANVADPEKGNDAASAAPVDFVPTKMAGGYYTSYIWGFYETPDDVDVYSFKLPKDVAVPVGSRAAAGITAFPPGVSGDGSTITTGEISIVDPMAPDVAVARQSPINSLRMRAPLTPDKEYLLFVKRPPATPKENDFYFLSAFPGWGNPVEKDDANNTDPAKPETITLSATDAYVEGDIAPITDLDHFKVKVPGGVTLVTAVCGAWTQGSGLRQLKISLLGDDGKPLSATATDTEGPSHIALVSDVPLGSTTSVVLKVEAGEQAPDTSSAYYQCGVHYK